MPFRRSEEGQGARAGDIVARVGIGIGIGIGIENEGGVLGSIPIPIAIPIPRRKPSASTTLPDVD
jgi:hypothetical protein